MTGQDERDAISPFSDLLSRPYSSPWMAIPQSGGSGFMIVELGEEADGLGQIIASGLRQYDARLVCAAHNKIGKDLKH